MNACFNLIVILVAVGIPLVIGPIGLIATIILLGLLGLSIGLVIRK